MNIQRDIHEQLLTWKKSPRRKPLILKGARQVGKTWTLKNFGESEFSDVAYFNFERQPGLAEIFSTTKEPLRIIRNLSLLHGKNIEKENTLIIFDEIQESNDALNALKYFSEENPEYVIAGAGSLLGVALSKGKSFPVGKVDFIQMYPLSFREFLRAADLKLFSFLEGIESPEPFPDIFFTDLVEKLRMYFISGGMPEAVVSLIEKQDVSLVQEILKGILEAYTLDFSKHVDKKDIQKINHLWSSLPSQLARENKKFLYQAVKTGARAREYEEALNWLINSGLVYRVNSNAKPAYPLSAYDDISAFKVYMSDTGLLRRLSGADPLALTPGNRLLTEFKGALTENFVLNSLVRQFGDIPRYWRSGNMAEVDFLITYQDKIIPAEVKSDENIKSRSLTLYRQKFQPTTSIRYSLRNLSKTADLINIPLFMADYTVKILQLKK